MRRGSATAPGAALVLALWMALLIGVAGMAALRLATAGGAGASTERSLARTRAAAEGALWAAAQALAAQPREARAATQHLPGTVGGIRTAVRMEDEDGRLDLNAAPEPLLAALFQAAGLGAGDAADAAARLLRWREEATPGGERRLRSIGDLDAVLGRAELLAPALAGVATVHTGRPFPAAEAAPPALRPILPDAAPAAARGLRTPRPQAGRTGRRMIWRLSAEASEGAVTARVVAVLMLDTQGNLPGRVLEWRSAAP